MRPAIHAGSALGQEVCEHPAERTECGDSCAQRVPLV